MFRLPATGTRDRKMAVEEPPVQSGAASSPPAAPAGAAASPPAAPAGAASSPPAEPAERVDALYPSMRGEVAEEAAPARQRVAEDHTAVIATGLTGDVAARFSFAGVVRQVRRFKDGRVFVRFGSAAAAQRALDVPGVVPTTSSRHRFDDDDDGDDDDNNKLFPHEVPGVHRDFKKRRLLMPRDHPVESR